jgi:hypothetical protein
MKNLTAFAMTLLGILSIFFYPQTTFAQSGRGWMDGFVVRESATNPAAGATVDLTSLAPRTGLVKRSAKADEQGHYTLKDIPYGDYLLRVSADGYRAYEIHIYIMPDVLTRLHVSLKKK